jgi:hypothetical protein
VILALLIARSLLCSPSPAQGDRLAGTLYRHLPTRENLILAVYVHDVQNLVGSAEDGLAAHPPWRRLPRC